MASETLRSAYRWHRTCVSAPIAARHALELAREDVARSFRRIPASAPGWNPADADGARWLEQPEACGLRYVGDAEKLADLRHSGWFTDDDGMSGETLRGAVYQLPARDGRALYVPGYLDPVNDGAARLWFADAELGAPGGNQGDNVREDDRAITSAALRADRLAEIAAEEEREHSAAWQAGTQWAELGKDVADLRARALKLARERKSMCAMLKDNPELEASHSFRLVCDAIRDAWERITALREKRAELADLPGYAIRKGLGDAFNDGAGESVIRA